MLAELGWALGSLLQRRYVQPGRLVNYTCLQMFAGAGFQLLMGCLDREWIGFSPAQVSWQSLLAVGYLVIFGSIIAVNCYSYLLAHVLGAEGQHLRPGQSGHRAVARRNRAARAHHAGGDLSAPCSWWSASRSVLWPGAVALRGKANAARSRSS